LNEAKKQVAASIADEKRLAKQYEQEAASASEWERRAMLALRAGNEELAKEALNRKREHDQLATTFQDQWTKQKNAVEQLKRALRMLNDKIEEAKRKKNVLVARKKRAEAQKSIQETMHGLKDQSAFETFDRMSAKIDQLEAEAEAGAEVQEEFTGDVLASQFSRLERSAGADDDLALLKRKMGLAPAVVDAPQAVAEPKARVEASAAKSAATAPIATQAEEDELAAALEEMEAEQRQEAKKVVR
jgi:phage shock protein A